ncbi:MAG: bifunctional oligoribonuclease/PAP phosphatase NrnA [Terracidiphilus sp.]|jgi:phosphoesterase RecJ-like protein
MNSLPRKSGPKVTTAPPVLAPQSGSRRIAGLSTDHPLTAILAVLDRGERFLVCSHTRPDGDSVGSMLALGMILEQMGKHADLATAELIPLQYRQLPGAGAILRTSRVHGPYDAAILLECDSIDRTRLHGLEKLYLINIDHHITGLEFARLNWIDQDAASVGEMVYQLARAAGVTITPQISECIYATLLTDTGGFCYGNVRESTFALARELIEAGADPLAVARQVYYSAPVSKLLLLGAALRRLKRERRLAWLWVTYQDMQRTHATEEDCEGIVNVALSMASIDTVIFLRELPSGRVRLSLRSKSGLNVAAIAARLGGGGHQNAAGCTLKGSLLRARKQIVAELRSAMSQEKGRLSRRV